MNFTIVKKYTFFTDTNYVYPDTNYVYKYICLYNCFHGYENIFFHKENLESLKIRIGCQIPVKK